MLRCCVSSLKKKIMFVLCMFLEGWDFAFVSDRKMHLWGFPDMPHECHTDPWNVYMFDLMHCFDIF